MRALQDELERDAFRRQRDALLADLERDYVAALNAVIAAPAGYDKTADANRWRGHAEAYRQVCQRIRRDGGLPWVQYGSDEWRREHGVYSEPYRL